MVNDFEDETRDMSKILNQNHNERRVEASFLKATQCKAVDVMLDQREIYKGCDLYKSLLSL